MPSVELNVELKSEKFTEFTQSWQTFISHVRNENGLEGFNLNQSDEKYEIVLRWKSQKSLDIFLEGKWYSYITGAIDVLGNKSEIKFIS